MTGYCDSRPRVTVLSLILLCLTFSNHYAIVPVAEALWFNLPSSGTKCVSEEIQNNVVVLAGYYVLNQEHPEYNTTVSVRVTSPYGNNLHHIEHVTHGNFAFTTTEAGNYLACFWIDSHQEQATEVTLSLEWKIGIFAKDWDSVARKEKIEGVELNIRRLKEHVEAIHSNLVYLKHREAEMREVSETTNGRVAWFSIMSLGLCLVVSVLQLWYLKSYFQRKRLI